MKKLFTLLAIMLFTLSFAQSQTDEQGDPFYQLVSASDYSDDSVMLRCWDVRDFYDDYDADTKTAVEAVFETDTVMGCMVSRANGSPYFFIQDLKYVAGGGAYTVGYGDFQEIQGETGELLPGSTLVILVAFKNAERGVPFRLFYDEASTEVTLNK